ncbi:uncharacterized protein H6S33_000382 [Morchella sextelata]|uniref:uncharacterized protein n=1 Tax=Morchella sextelata TaxID=1174677 RepID=UPI001D050E61|nr:uncharacterized protein H6S33_000382 [Morchella sextelata]KAH0614746.1 hypothetical protein H6S33_000382 [Morchella sextelata]
MADVHEESAPIIADDDSSSSSDDGYSSGPNSYTTSLASSVLNYKYENGRRYHSFRDGQYVLPNDETEQDRLDLFHHIFCMILDGELQLAPIGDNPQRVLDIGTGTGIWAMDFADRYPSATVIANDLSPIQPAWVPPNCQFEIDDAESEWSYSSKFDFIHIRALGGAITDWPKLFRQAYKHLNPGGWIEVVEPQPRPYCDDGTLSKDGYMIKISDLFAEALNKIGKIGDPAERQKEWMVEAGFVNAAHKMKKLPNNPWPKDPKLKELGVYHLQNMLAGIEAYMMAPLTRTMGLSTEDAKMICDGACKEVANRKIHLYSRVWITTAQKPLEDEE